MPTSTTQRLPRLVTNPQRPDAIIPFKGLVSKEGEMDYYGTLAMILGVLGLLWKQRYASWGCLIACLASTANAKQSTSDANRTVFSTFMFGLMGLVTAYMQEFYVPMQLAQKQAASAGPISVGGVGETVKKWIFG